ncbi:MAG: Asp23/Gls24 family envelope stress response protein [Ruminococcaceae bacterium]|nr:Asp23/Gls24 family envelope stress response protein [Oscillospiraceae bacterium]
MADNKEYMTRQEELGSIQVSEDVIAAIATSAALETDGVGGLLSNAGGKKLTAKGVRVDMDEAGLVVSLFIMIRYGCSVTEIANRVQNAVFTALSDMTGFSVHTVNVHVGGISFE